MLQSIPATLALFDVGGGELFVLAVIALLLFGGELPKMARKVGRVVGDLKRQADNITREWREIDMEESRTMQLKKPATRVPPPRQEPATPAVPALDSTPTVEPPPAIETTEPLVEGNMTPPADPTGPPPKPPEATGA